MSIARIVDLKELGVDVNTFEKIYRMGEEDGKADERRKFAKWLQKSNFWLDYIEWKKCVRVFDDESKNYKISHVESRTATLGEVLEEYEKEQKGEGMKKEKKNEK